MEDKRSVHSIHSMRSTRSYLTRPISDISYIDEETLSPTSAASRAVAAAAAARNSNGGGYLGTGQQRGATAHGMRSKVGGGSSEASGIGDGMSVTVPTNKTNNNVVRGETYRVQTKAASGEHQKRKTKPRHCSDAQTQSAESSFAVAEAEILADGEEALAAQDSGQNLGVFVQVDMPTPGTQSAIPLGPPSPFLPASQSPGLVPASTAHLLPSPLYPAPGFGYDPTYCQYLGQAADGYQYELVRRPSVGAELMVPGFNPLVQRRLSGGGTGSAGPGGGTNSAGGYPQSHSPVPPAAYSSVTPALAVPCVTAPHLANLSSMPGSFESCGPPPPAPIFMQQQVPLRTQPAISSAPMQANPRHFMTTPPANLYANTPQPAPLASAYSSARPASSSQHAAAPDTWANSGEMPKMIHETSIWTQNALNNFSSLTHCLPLYPLVFDPPTMLYTNIHL